MLAAGSVMILGVTAIALVSQATGLRVGGVMVIPLVAVYTFLEPWTPIVFLLAWGAAYGALHVVRSATLHHGRRPLLIAIAVGALTSISFVGMLDLFTGWSVAFHEAEIVGSIFPGIAAYNVMRLDPDRRITDLAIAVGIYATLVVAGAVLLLATPRVPVELPAVLFANDVAAVGWLGLEAPRSRFPRIMSQWLVAGLILGDVVIYEWVRARYAVPLSGVILVPLLAVFSARMDVAFLLYAVLATATFVAVTGLHWFTLLYGRNLLALALVIGTGLAFLLGLVTPEAPGLLVFFVGLFAAVGAYNLHRTSPGQRAANVLLSAGLFVLLYGTILVIVEPPASGLASPFRWYHVATGGVTLALAGRELLRLERGRPDADAIDDASVFSGGGLR
ncbi:hypothetical protein JCM17823_11480 [Halorubrum gandharaense]